MPDLMITTIRFYTDMMIFFKGGLMKTITSNIILVVLSAVVLSCAPGRYLRTEVAAPSEITGNYILMLYGGRYSDDIENVAILDKEGDPYTFEIFARPDNYTVHVNVPAKEILDESQKFVRTHRSFLRSKLSRIIGPNGNVIGYELRPLYQMLEFGSSDVLSINYRIKDSKVIIDIRPSQAVEHNEPFLFRRMRK